MTATKQVEHDETSTEATTSERLALAVFVAYLVVAGVLVLFWLGDYHWFFGDEWSFLAERNAGDLDDLFRSHGEHWVTLPILSYRLLYNVFGLESYLPYQAVVVVGHLVCAGLLRVVMRRAGVGPWTATIAASVFVLFGPGEENIVWAFQIAFVFAFMFGLTQLILSDHDGPVDHRDWLGLAAGTAALMSSGLSLVMVVVVGLAVLVRRGWSMAAFHTAPLAGLYLVWYLATDPGGIDNPFGRSATIGEMVEFVWSGVPAGLEAAGGSMLVGVAMAVVLVVGVGLIVRRDPEWRRIAPSASLLAGAAMFLVGTGYTRWFITLDAGSQSRYLYTIVGFGLPLLAVAADMIIRQRRQLAPLVLLPFVVAIVVNLDGFGDRDPWNPAYHASEQRRLLTLAHSDLADQVPAYVRPNSWFTVGWLRDEAERGAVPEPGPGATASPDALVPLVAIAHLDEPIDAPCRAVADGTRLEPTAGDRIGFAFTDPPPEGTPFFFQDAIVFTRIGQDGQPMGTIAFSATTGTTLEFELDGLRLDVAAAADQELLLCR
ncbi:MAG: hypothetical protein OES57_04165 [Acidimicrobiia bacterium]|nr:hypothetical protein [Acidimicrobiia bacterium]